MSAGPAAPGRGDPAGPLAESYAGGRPLPPVIPSQGRAPAPSRCRAEGDWDTGEAAAAVRPYAWTRGRTTSAHELAIEALVSTSEHYREADPGGTPSEYHAVAALCHRPRSVAEVAALLAVPLGVARVLLGDMVGLGLLRQHRTLDGVGEGPRLDLMERILAGLHRL